MKKMMSAVLLMMALYIPSFAQDAVNISDTTEGDFTIDVPIQSTPVVGTHTNAPSDSGVVMNEELVEPFYGRSANKAIVTNIISPDIIAYPNPVINSLNVILPDIASRPVHAYLFNMQGVVIHALVYAPGGNQISVDMTSVPSGMYNLRVYEEGLYMDQLRINKQ